MNEIKHEGLLEAISLLETTSQDNFKHAISKIRHEQGYIEQLQSKLKTAEGKIIWLKAENILLAKLASETPEFYSPKVIAGAKAVRDRILKGIGQLTLKD